MRAINVKAKKDNMHLSSSGGIDHSTLTRRQKVLSVVFLVVLPYFKSKLHSIYNKEREARLQASLWGEDDKFTDVDVLDRAENTLIPSGNSDRETSIGAFLSKKIQKIVGACYSLVHASSEGLSFAYQLLYLLDATGFYSLGLHAWGFMFVELQGKS